MLPQLIYEVLWDVNVRQVFPINDDKVSIKYNKEEENVYFKETLNKELIFDGRGANDFNFFMGFENDLMLRCTDFKVSIKKLCNNVYNEVYVGKFNLTDAEFDLDKCTIKVKLTTDDLYNCINESKALETNILDLPNVITTQTFESFPYEYFVCVNTGTCTPIGVGWLPFSNGSLPYNKYSSCSVVSNTHIIYYREVANSDCVAGLPNPPAPDGNGAWTLETNNCILNGTSKYVRTPVQGSYVGLNPSVVNGFIDSLTPDSPPAQPKVKSVVVTNTPSTPSIIGNNNIIQDWEFEYHVEYNPNSTYLWEFLELNVISQPSVIVSGQGTNKVRINYPNSLGNALTNTIRVTETHGNSFVSVQNLAITNNINSNSNLIFNFVMDNGNVTNIYCKGQQNIIIEANDFPTITPFASEQQLLAPTFSIISGNATITNVTNNIATITSGTINSVIKCEYKMAGVNFGDDIFGWSRLFNINVSTTPLTNDIKGIFSVYPNEPNLTYTIQNRVSQKLWRADGATFTGQGTNTITLTAAPSTFCLQIKETISCGCAYQKILNGDNITFNYPPLYVCNGGALASKTYTRNRSFKEVCEEIVLNTIPCGVTALVSDFFEWNPIGDTIGYTPTYNYVTTQSNKLTYLTISQKSDVIDPTSSNAAIIGIMTFEMIETIWREMFNAYWFIDSSNNLRVEHISWFNRVVSWNALAAPHAKFNLKKNKYTYNKQALPKRESYKFMESFFVDFFGKDIIYTNTCANKDSKTNVKEHAVDFVTTDITGIEIYPTDVNVEGFVLFCNQFDGFTYVVDFEVGQISGLSFPNNHLSWANLHYNYHRHNRVFIDGTMNDVAQTFITEQRKKQQTDITLIKCCGDVWQPETQLVTTGLGDGEITEAEWDLLSNTIKTNLKHE